MEHGPISKPDPSPAECEEDLAARVGQNEDVGVVSSHVEGHAIRDIAKTCRVATAEAEFNTPVFGVRLIGSEDAVALDVGLNRYWFFPRTALDRG